MGSGGYAHVHQTNYNGRECIRKVLRSELVGKGFERERFLREYRILKELEHPNIIKVFRVDGDSYIMEKADSDLEQYASVNSLSEDEIDKIIDGIVSGISALHSQEIIHRDLKPANILMVKGQPKIADLGVCKPLDTETIQTMLEEREGLGTLPYMSRGHLNGGSPTFHFDIFALGRIIYFLERLEHPPIGVSPSLTDCRYKALILATESQDPIQVQNIDEFMKIRQRIFSFPEPPLRAIDQFSNGGISISELVNSFEKKGARDEYDLLRNRFYDIVSKVRRGDNTSLKLLYEVYINEFEVYTDRNYWPFSRCNDTTTQLLHLHDLSTSDILSKRILSSAFKYSYVHNQWKAMDLFDSYVVGKGSIFFYDSIQVLLNELHDEDLVKHFSERCSNGL